MLCVQCYVLALKCRVADSRSARLGRCNTAISRHSSRELPANGCSITPGWSKRRRQRGAGHARQVSQDDAAPRARRSTRPRGTRGHLSARHWRARPRRPPRPQPRGRRSWSRRSRTRAARPPRSARRSGARRRPRRRMRRLARRPRWPSCGSGMHASRRGARRADAGRGSGVRRGAGGVVRGVRVGQGLRAGAPLSRLRRPKGLACGAAHVGTATTREACQRACARPPGARARGGRGSRGGRDGGRSGGGGGRSRAPGGRAGGAARGRGGRRRGARAPCGRPARGRGAPG
jgi:hypothetical protein